MFIKSIEWIDKESQEAEVLVSDSSFSVTCFSHPFNKRLGERLVDPIHCLDVENVVDLLRK